ncbi:kinase-like domain-containing protein [Infundibulicybe gibba]|nr:kinase-like domain-containing protein [Infundibulicybe gibba]
MARVYTNVNHTLGRSWYDYDNFHIEWSQPERYEIIGRLGGGKYSEVGLFQKIKREMKVLRNLRGGPNVVELLDVVRDASHRHHSLVLEYVDSFDWKQLVSTLSELEVKHYLFQLLKGLDFVHSRGIMHRDIKPGNVMIDHRHRKLRIIDWGLAEFYHLGMEYPVRVGSRYYKAPELLVGYKRYDYSLDMWSVGCMFASMIFRKEHFFRGVNNNDQLLRILKTLGTEQFDWYLRRYGIHYETHLKPLLINYPKIHWYQFIAPDNQALVSADAVDLLERLLKYDHHERLTAREAQAHFYFNSVRLEATPVKEESVSDSGFGSA